MADAAIPRPSSQSRSSRSNRRLPSRRAHDQHIGIFEDGAVIRYQFVGAPEDREASENLFKTADKSAIAREMERRAGWFRRYAQQDIVLSDDLGTEYRVQPRGASGGTLKWESGFTISPSIPPDACQLRLTVAKLDFPWDLPGQTDSDPATFLIDL